MKMKYILGAVASATAIATSAFTASADVLKFAHVYEVSHPLHAAALEAAKQFSAATDGRHSIEVFPASALGKEAALNEGLGLGIVDIIYTGAGFAGSIYGPASMTDLNQTGFIGDD